MVQAEYLRYTLGLTGTKIGCGEGGCGACTVYITRAVSSSSSRGDGGGGGGGDSDSETERTLANSCLRPVCSLDGAAIVTVEGVKGMSGARADGGADGYHPIQTAMAECGGSQCGYEMTHAMLYESVQTLL